MTHSSARRVEGPGDSQYGPEATLLFLHIPKTAGKTLVGILRREYGAKRVFEAYSSPPTIRLDEYCGLPPDEKARYRAVTGHFSMGFDRCVPGPFAYVTFLRDPVARVLSTYAYIRRRASHVSHALLAGPDMTIERVMTERRMPMLDNGQTRALSGMEPPYGECDEAMLEAAIANLEDRMAVVGLTERFDESLLMMRRKLGWRVGLYSRQNVAPRKNSPVDLSASTLDSIRRYNQLDLRLYAHAQRIFERSVAEEGPAFPGLVRLFSLANSMRNRGVRLASTLRGVSRFRRS